MKESGSTSLPVRCGARRVGIFSLLLLKTQGQMTAGWSSFFMRASRGFQSKFIRIVSLRMVRKYVVMQTLARALTRSAKEGALGKTMNVTSG